jgi:peptide/nickel transport system permease protein
MTDSTASPANLPSEMPAVSARPARGPWATALRKLRSDRAAMAALLLFLLVVALCLLAPLYAKHVAHTDPFRSNLSGKIILDGKPVPVMQPSTEGLGLGFTPIGPTWDVTALFPGCRRPGPRRRGAACSMAGALALHRRRVRRRCHACGYRRPRRGLLRRCRRLGAVAAARRALGLPVYLLAISLSIVLISHGIDIGPISITAGSLALPIFIIGIIYVPYVARPIRGQVLALTQSEFVLAAIGLGVPNYRILFRDILPNVMTTLIVFVPLMMAINMLTESALSFLSIGVQPPDASWGTIIQDGQGLLYTRPRWRWRPVSPSSSPCSPSTSPATAARRPDPRSKLRIRAA